LAVVDSGADRTFLPKNVASHLGIGEDELVMTPQGGTGVEGRSFPTWASTVPITGRVVTAAGLWGPRFPLEPLFADLGLALLGRADFFRAFTVTFQEHPATPVYHLDAA
jgi:hypothetical protein